MLSPASGTKRPAKVSILKGKARKIQQPSEEKDNDVAVEDKDDEEDFEEKETKGEVDTSMDRSDEEDTREVYGAGYQDEQKA